MKAHVGVDAESGPAGVTTGSVHDAKVMHRLVRKVHPDPIDPQFRIATPEVDWWIAITLTEDVKERERRLALVSDFMTWKFAPGFILASEPHEPDAILSVGIRHSDYSSPASAQ
jgi:hypothetical protein